MLCAPSIEPLHNCGPLARIGERQIMRANTKTTDTETNVRRMRVKPTNKTEREIWKIKKISSSRIE